MSKRPDIFAHVPVVHAGYTTMFDRYPNSPIGVMNESITEKLNYLRKDIRQLGVEQATRALRGLGYAAYELSTELMESMFRESERTIVMPDDDMTRTLMGEYDVKADIWLDSTFLRWDRQNTKTNIDIIPDRTVSTSELVVAPDVVGALAAESSKSSDWWRHVAAGLIHNDELVLAHNRAMPNEHANWIEGDPRIIAKRGEDIDLSLFIHAESSLVAEMARLGLSTQGKEIFVSTFPCPNCAKLIAEAGFSKVYFMEGYAMLDGQRVLHDYGIEIIKVDTKAETFVTDGRRLRPYLK